MAISSKDWIEDCIRYWGYELTGLRAHWCHDWDGLPIDETRVEIDCCACFPSHYIGE